MYNSNTSGSRSAGAGAALLVNGVIIGGLVLFVAPTVVKKIVYPPMTGIIIPETTPPPPIDTPKPVDEKMSREYPVVVPETPITPIVTENLLQGTTEVPKDATPPVDMGKPEGTDRITVESPITPPTPPLIAAQIDSRYQSAFQPDYPPSELRAEREGTVSVRVLIGMDGRVKAVEQVRATSAAFFEATKRHAMRSWRFKPASRGGTPQESWKVMNVRFEMTGMN